MTTISDEERARFVWRSADGRTTALRELEDSHLVNIERYLREGRSSVYALNGAGAGRMRTLEIARDEIARRGLTVAPPSWPHYASEGSINERREAALARLRSNLLASKLGSRVDVEEDFNK